MSVTTIRLADLNAGDIIRVHENGTFICEGEFLQVDADGQFEVRTTDRPTPFWLFTKSPASGWPLAIDIELVQAADTGCGHPAGSRFACGTCEPCSSFEDYLMDGAD